MPYFVEATYIHHDGCKFDYDHYANVHLPLAERQMAKGKLPFLKRVLQKRSVNFFTGAPLDALSLTYVLESQGDVRAFQEFMHSEHVAPLVEDAEKYTDCVLIWSTGEYSEL